MARIATSDGFAEEHVGVQPGDDSTVRRQFFKGSEIPDNWDVKEGSVDDDVEVNRAGLGAAAPFYKNQLDPETGEVKEEHADQGDAEEGGAQPLRRGRGRRAGASKEREESSSSASRGRSSS